jgi:hypothetical protein
MLKIVYHILVNKNGGNNKRREQFTTASGE